MQPQDISTEVLIEKYAKGGETTVAEVQQRVAAALAQVEAPEHREAFAKTFLHAMQDGFIPAGRVASAAGTDLQTTLINCFVQPVADSVSESVNGRPGIYTALAQAAETMRRGGGVGYNFSHIRPKGARVKGTGSAASGPISYMKVFDRSCETVESAGARRGAQMAVLNVEHPDVFDFITAKKERGQLNNFNISVGVSNAFMQAVQNDAAFELVHDAEPCDEIKQAGGRQREDGKWVYRTVAAREIWEAIMQNTYNAAEPGVLFLDRINEENNLHYCETIDATNPCGEQSLPDYGCCCLGSVNLAAFVEEPFSDDAWFNEEKFAEVVAIAVRMLDNVLTATKWPLQEQATEAANKRRIGLGYTGLGDALIMLGIRYNSPQGRAKASRITALMRDNAYLASIDLAKERGAFPLFNKDKYLASGFAKRLHAYIREAIATHGIRNSHLLSIAPTGTISLAFADNASNGVEPAFSWFYNRTKRMPDGSKKQYVVEDHAYRLYKAQGGDVASLPEAFVSALEMSADDHLQMVATVAPYIDAAISKTVNVPAEYPYEDFKNLYLDAWKAGLKGITTYRPNDILGAVLSVEAPKAVESQAVATNAPVENNPLTHRIESRPLGELDAVAIKDTYWTNEGAKKVFLVMSFAKVDGVVNGQPVTIERPIEVFMPAGQSEGQQWITSHMRLLSRSARKGDSVAEILADMREVPWDKGPVRCGTIEKKDGSGARVPLYHDSEVAAIAYLLQSALKRRGFLDEDGNQVPVEKLAALYAARNSGQAAVEVAAEAPKPVTYKAVGKKCRECNTPSVIKRDGCEYCQHCGAIGSCG
ncbi:adenosylcobalamin-dependent ribonucleoside-diphosphate reductase [Noviherbaspirillum sp. 17J57-3]|uniref:Vitamin B12-dependent ribonucleotide reductase n=2 Tax=Noviherbaspirillum galbum TaxID=2709383 RepID=A0A6B3SP96_9BURK|nr:adenosylcobalamin-dependent ribonucleoside-diphosphate reductase [Noviherbaspirillum galbum]